MEVENETSIMVVRERGLTLEIGCADLDGEEGLNITAKVGDVEIEVIAKKFHTGFQLETGDRIYHVGL